MTYFKIIQDNKVVSVGTVFLCWRSDKNRMFVCDVNDGEFVQSYDEQNVYRDDWMKPIPKGAKGYSFAEVVIINQIEYEDLLAQLSEGEEIEVELPRPEEIQTEIEPPEKEEKPMSIADMREIIKQQQEQIEILMNNIKGAG